MKTKIEITELKSEITALKTEINALITLIKAFLAGLGIGVATVGCLLQGFLYRRLLQNQYQKIRQFIFYTITIPT